MMKIKGLTFTKAESLSSQTNSPNPIVPLKKSGKQALAALKEVSTMVNVKGITNQKATKTNKPTNIYKGGRMGSK